VTDEIDWDVKGMEKLTEPNRDSNSGSFVLSPQACHSGCATTLLLSANWNSSTALFLTDVCRHVIQQRLPLHFHCYLCSEQVCLDCVTQEGKWGWRQHVVKWIKTIYHTNLYLYNIHINIYANIKYINILHIMKKYIIQSHLQCIPYTYIFIQKL